MKLLYMKILKSEKIAMLNKKQNNEVIEDFIAMIISLVVSIIIIGIFMLIASSQFGLEK